MPLGYLVWRHRKAMEALEPRHRTCLGGRCIYLMALVNSADDRRVAVLLDALLAQRLAGQSGLVLVDRETLDRVLEERASEAASIVAAARYGPSGPPACSSVPGSTATA